MESQTKIKDINALALEILGLARSTLLVNLRFMDTAICRLKPRPYKGSIAVTGEYILYSPEYVAGLYKMGKEQVIRAYLHMVFHCIFQHFAEDEPESEDLWDLACDIAVENVINELDLKCTDNGSQKIQEELLAPIRRDAGIITAEKLYRYFKDGNVPDDELIKLKVAFALDDHKLWYKSSGVTAATTTFGSGDSDHDEDSEGGEIGFGTDEEGEDEEVKQLKKMWSDISEMLLMNLESFAKKQGDSAGDMMQNLKAVTREKYDYAEFLKKFAVMGEEMTINDEDFDYIFYTYGLKMYGNMPLIEPLEYKEAKRIKDFVIAIDTSGSVSGELVQKFIQKTYNILEQQENFFTKINVHILQCDTEIKEHVKVTSKQDFDKYMDEMTLKGFGGTDFRPVFQYVDEMKDNGEFTDFKGLIYFTDGFGTFPSKPPDYEAAFIFVDDEYNNYDVPVWAIKLILQSNEI